MAKTSDAGRLVIGYTRCSTKAQDAEDKAYGRAVQMRAIAVWADLQEVTIDRWIHDTCTGATLERDGLAEMRALVAASKVQTVVFARQDRLARDAHLAETLYQEFEAAGAELVNATSQFERSMYGKMLRRLLDNFAELDRLQIAERTNKGRRAAVLRHGTHQYGYRVLGYRLLKREEAERRGLPHGSLEIVPHEAEIVRIAFALRERGHSFGQIADWLNTHGYKSKTDSRFAAATIQAIVESEGFYRAERVGVSAKGLGISDEEYAALKPAHEPILPPRPAGQALLADRMKRSPMVRAALPEDPFTEEPPERRKTCQVPSVSRDYAEAILKARRLLAEGLSCEDVAEALNRDGHRTRRGGPFYWQAIDSMRKRFADLVPLAEEAMGRSAPDAPDLRADDWEGPARLAHSLARQGISRKRGEMSYSKIAEALNAEFGTTPNGGKFYSQTVIRLLAEYPAVDDGLRTAAYVRFTKDGVDHHGQEDALGVWAESNGLKIDEWYVDRGSAHKSIDNPDLRRLLTDAEAGRVHRVVVLSLERFCSDRLLANEVLRRLSARAEVFVVGASSPGVHRAVVRAEPPARR